MKFWRDGRTVNCGLKVAKSGGKLMKNRENKTNCPVKGSHLKIKTEFFSL
jgi:hypothetical protein